MDPPTNSFAVQKLLQSRLEWTEIAPSDIYFRAIVKLNTV